MPPHSNMHARRVLAVQWCHSWLRKLFTHIPKHTETCACYMDVKQAFDSVYWNGLFYKLHIFGICNKLWLIYNNWFRGSSCKLMVNG